MRMMSDHHIGAGIDRQVSQLYLMKRTLTILIAPVKSGND
ncbi:MAG: hypothetical protein UW84_C0051G0015 [Candidatus Collierbacteria bacterium GW2011_GWA2_44_99]|uniref:Uncharacterized protein n=1 Tax=Candidatus Collierbacteria bacterium GW2011_GWA2_44_99 TaxID=1618380 RepID=A0A0G1KM13_9BACT|nr:MAG: hypothetical protein UW84_C0051G0015 [Candidatus Collierbacteria bacterium GW2011_GWA2_44_99]